VGVTLFHIFGLSDSQRVHPELDRVNHAPWFSADWVLGWPAAQAIVVFCGVGYPNIAKLF
jgi:hypothetical protein